MTALGSSSTSNSQGRVGRNSSRDGAEDGGGGREAE